MPGIDAGLRRAPRSQVIVVLPPETTMASEFADLSKSILAVP
jgi:hypothetical protein